MATSKTADKAAEDAQPAEGKAPEAQPAAHDSVTLSGDSLSLVAIAAARSALQSRGSTAARAVAAMLAEAAPALPAGARQTIRNDISAYGAASPTGDPWQDMDAEPWALLDAALA